MTTLEFDLPRRFAIWHSSNPWEAQEWSACLVIATKISQGNYKLNIQDNPTQVFGMANCMPQSYDEWLWGTWPKVQIHTQNARSFETVVQFQKFVIQGGTLGNEKIPILKISNASHCLGHSFKNLLSNQGISNRFYMQPKQIISIPTSSAFICPSSTLISSSQTLQASSSQAYQQSTIVERSYLQSLIDTFFQTTLSSQVKSNPTPPKKSSIPQHVINGFLETQFNKNETCPISGEVLQKETTYLTPCGHAISFYAANGWVLSHKSCPVCRSNCTMSDLRTFV